MPVDDVTRPVSHVFADVKLSDVQLRDLVSDAHGRYVYAITSRRVCLLVSLLVTYLPSSDDDLGSRDTESRDTKSVARDKLLTTNIAGLLPVL